MTPTPPPYPPIRSNASASSQPSGLKRTLEVSGAAAESDVDSSTLVGLLQNQIKQYQALKELSRQQGDLVDRQDADALLSLLGRRQTFIDRLAELGRQLQPFRENWDAHLAALPQAARTQVTGLLADIQVLQQQIQKQDDRDFALLQTAKSQAGQQISHVRQSAQASRSYQQAATAYRHQPISLYTDRRG